MLQNNILPFLTDLSENNNREWFNENKDRFILAKEDFNHFVDFLLARISEFDPLLKGTESKDCIFRIYRDVRFSKDKNPYKTHFGAYMAPGGRKAMNPGYYIHIDPAESFIGGGLYSPPPDKLKMVRENILEDPEGFISIIENEDFKNNLKLFDNDKLKTAPKGFPKDFEHIDLLRYKHYVPTKQLENKLLGKDNFIDTLLDYFELIKPFNDYIRDTLS